MMCNQREIKVFSGLPDLSTCMNVQEMLTHGAHVSAGSTNSLADRNMNLKAERIKIQIELTLYFFMPLQIIFNFLGEFHCTSDTTEFRFKGLCDLASTQLLELIFQKFPFIFLYLNLTALLTASCKYNAFSFSFSLLQLFHQSEVSITPLFLSAENYSLRLSQNKQTKKLLHQKIPVKTNHSFSTWLVSPS